MHKCFLVFGLLIAAVAAHSQNELLQAGPMPGYSDYREALVWVQTTQPAKVTMEYWVKGDRSTQAAVGQQTKTLTGHTAHLTATNLRPGTTYTYEIKINGEAITLPYPTEFNTQIIWAHRTDPPDFKVALGSCTYINEPEFDRPGNPYGGDYQIFNRIADTDPDMMIWMGDNTYFREADWGSWSGILGRHTNTRSVPELQRFLASTHHYAIWDDHDFGPNDSDRSFYNKEKTLKAFQLFWGNPGYGINGQPGITNSFIYADCQFFLLDNRYYRSPKNLATGDLTILGPAQIDWLIDGLKTSKAKYKFVAMGGQFLNNAQVFENYACWEDERALILERLAKENIKNVIFLSGDRHHSELSKYTDPTTGLTYYDLTVSPLTSGAVKEVKETNDNLVEGTQVTQRNFGVMEFSGPWKDRKLRIRLYDSDGKELWTRQLMNGTISE